MNSLWRICRLQKEIRGSLKACYGASNLISPRPWREQSTSSLIPFGWVKNKEARQDSTPDSTATQNNTQSIVKVPETRPEKFIPVPRRTLLKTLREEEGLLNSKEKKLTEKLAAALDAYYSQKFYAILEEAKLLYDYMDPDKDTYQTKELTKKEILDSEYWLLQKVEKFLDKANYFEIPKHQLNSFLHDRDTDGLIVSVDPSDYELLRIWTRGKATLKRSRLHRLRSLFGSLILRKDASANSKCEVYTRVFVAVRSRGEKKLFLKVFKEVPCGKLECLLPDGKIKMSRFDKGFIATSVLVGGATVAMRSLPVIADWMKVQWTWLGVGMAGIFAARAWAGYKNKRNQYLANLATTLYYKTVANNRGVLTLLADRAQDEEFKEAFLAYIFLLSPRNRRGIPGTAYTAEPPIYDDPESLKSRIDKWLSLRFDLKQISFDIDDALEKLDNLGLLIQRKDGTLSVHEIEESLAMLPDLSNQWLVGGTTRDSESADEESEVELVPQQHGWR